MDSILTDTDFEKFRVLIYDESGIHFSESNRAILESRLRERLKAADMQDVGSYYSLIRANEGELKILLDSVTTNLTRFFRNKAHFQSFEHFVVPEILSRKQQNNQKEIRIWSAGCSTGEEPYSLAIVLKEILPAHMGINITASDLSLKSLMTAKEAYYPDTRVGDVPDKYLEKYFERVTGGYRILDSIRKLVKFDYHNLKFESGQKNLDVIFCRNVIIYFDEAAQKAVIDKFYNALAPESYLFIGHSESLFGMNTQFEFIKTDWATLYRKARHE
jgi:chemotaxis protein methyltransferase CheR